MKKFFAMAAIALFTLTSCSEDDAAPTNPGENPVDPVLVKKIVRNDVMFGESVSIFAYDEDNKLISITDPETSEGSYYTYNGNLITKIEVKDAEGNTFSTKTYEYDSNGRAVVMKQFLSTAIDPDEIVFKNVYIYNEDGTVSTTQYWGDQESQLNVGASAVIYITSGNIIKTVFTGVNGMGEPGSPVTTNYQFDNKNTPEKNIPGLSALTVTDNEGGLNNIISVAIEGETYNSTFTYNAGNYPITKTFVSSQGQVNYQYFYE